MDIFTEQLLKQYVKDSDSTSEVIRKFGLEVTGSRHRHVKTRIQNFKIDTSHFDYGVARLRAQKDKGFNKKHFSIVLVYGTIFQRPILKRALIEAGKAYVCEICLVSSLWQDKELTLQIDHKNGDRKDNTFTNLRFLCPNCHSQTPTYSNKQRNKVEKLRKLRQKQIKNCCISCGNMIGRKSLKCRRCHLQHVSQNQKHHISWPSLEELKLRIAQSNKLQVSKQLGISWNGLEKHLRREKIASRR